MLLQRETRHNFWLKKYMLPIQAILFSLQFFVEKKVKYYFLIEK